MLDLTNDIVQSGLFSFKFREKCISN